MKTTKTLFFIGITTITALLYVHQQIELIKLGYDINNKEKKNLYLLDRRQKLVYNLNNLEAPSRLERKLADTGFEFTFPSSDKVIKIVKAPEAKKSKMVRLAGFSRNKVLDTFADLLGLGAEAQAKEK